MFTKTKGPDGTQPTNPSTSPAQDAIRPATAKPTARTAPSIISGDMNIIGSVTSDGEMQIDGRIEGDVSASSLTVGTTGKIEGEVKAETIIVRGHIKGAIRARKVELETGSRVIGDIVHSSLSIQANAVFEGQVKHADDPLKQQLTSQGSAPSQNQPAAPTAAPSAPAAAKPTNSPSS